MVKPHAFHDRARMLPGMRNSRPEPASGPRRKEGKMQDDPVCAPAAIRIPHLSWLPADGSHQRAKLPNEPKFIGAKKIFITLLENNLHQFMTPKQIGFVWVRLGVRRASVPGRHHGKRKVTARYRHTGIGGNVPRERAVGAPERSGQSSSLPCRIYSTQGAASSVALS